MSSAEPPAGPKIADEKFWLSRAAEIIEESSEKLDQGAQRIAAAMAWFWAAYSTVATAAFALSGTRVSIGVALLAATPALALFLAYGVATWASLPVPVNFNVIAPYEIKDAHQAAIDAKRRRLRLSIGIGAVAAILVACVGLTFTISPAFEERGMAIAFSDTSTGPEIVIGGRIPESGIVLVRITPVGGAASTKTIEGVKDRDLDITIPVAAASAYDVEVSWHVGARTTLIKESIKP